MVRSKNLLITTFVSRGIPARNRRILTCTQLKLRVITSKTVYISKEYLPYSTGPRNLMARTITATFTMAGINRPVRYLMTSLFMAGKAYPLNQITFSMGHL
jgi:hypothetical protein